MFKRILVLLDTSPIAEQVIPCARLLASKLGGTVILFHAVEPARRDQHGGAPADADTLRARAMAYLETVGEGFRSAGVPVEREVRMAHAADAVLDYAAHEQVDLIAMATHGRGGIQRWAYGSVADKVLHAGRTPLLLVRAHPLSPAPPQTLRRIMVTLDRSELAEQALPYALQVAKAFDAEILLYHIWDTSGYTFDVSHDPAVERVMRDTFSYSQNYLVEMTHKLLSEGVRVQWQAESGNVANHILGAAEKQSVDLVVMSTHGLSGLGRWMLGSVADRVLRHSVKPVLLIRTLETAKK